AEQFRIGLWSPVMLGAGAAAYFLQRSEPAFWVAPLLTAAAVGAFRIEKARLAAAAAILFAAGFAAAQFRTASVDAPSLSRPISFATIEGRLRAVDEAPKSRRLVIDVHSIDGIAKEATPRRVRVTWRGREFAARPGDIVVLRASLSPPPTPAAPGGFDFARQLYFQGVGAVGFAVSAPEVVPEDARPLIAAFRASIEGLRVRLAARISAASPGDAGAIVAAVVTGKREAISDAAEAAFRDSGLAHLLSISGLHMGLATGLIYFALRALLALIEPLALTQPIKKWAALAALVSGFLYLLISGGAWPAQRAFIMTSIFFIAIIADRRALSLRNVAIAAFVIILMTPEAVLHPGFQMSFAAVTALIAWYEWASARADPSRSFSAFARLRRYVGGVAVTDVIASAATAPYALFHFNRAANFGLPANVLSIPLMGFWVMPAAIVALLAMPFGADAPFWRLAAGGVDVMLRLAEWTRALPGAVTVFPAWPASSLFFLTIGGLWLCLMSAPWRLGGLAALPVAATLIAANPHPGLFLSADGDNVGALVEDKFGKAQLAVIDLRKSKFDARVWMEEAGIDAEKQSAAALAEFFPCDASGCVVATDGAEIAVSRDRSGLDDDCARADLVIALYVVAKRDRAGCKARLIDRRDAWEKGAHAVYVRNGNLRIETAAARRGDRPWTD
ncbi:MAG: ComEC/Rec2 family competence protein, partial [Parvularculaceae bacterium]|nr:ComEC/Rec2 family competence protein [Parvularculaceae bacterium]